MPRILKFAPLESEEPYPQTLFNNDIHSEKNNEKVTNQYCTYLDLTVFKIYPCKLDTSNHNLKRCPYYHDIKKDRRR